MKRRLEFVFDGVPPVALELDEGAALADELTLDRCPALLGCRTGICGTCVAAVTSAEPIEPPDEDERELLELVAPEQPRARLLCRLRVTCDLVIGSVES